MFINVKSVLTSLLILFAFLLFTYSVSALTVVSSPEDVGISATVGSIPTLDTGGGGGVYQSGVKFSGFAYPRATVIVRKGTTTKTSSVIADDKGAFSIVIPETSWQLFTLSATDTLGHKSTLLNFPTVLYTGYLTDISGIRFAPTIATDKLAVKKGDYIAIAGAALPNVQAEINFDGPESFNFTLSADKDGLYSITVPLSAIEGEYLVKIHYVGDGRSSKVIRVIVGNANILRAESTENIPGDCNADQQINIVDFSVLAYWFGKSNPPKCVDTNNDGVINLVDFSILAFYWNG